MKASLWRYALCYILAGLALLGLFMALEAAAAIRFPSGVGTVLPPMTAAMLEGQRLARKHRREMPAPDAWRAAWAMTAVVVVLNGLVLAGLVAAAPELRDSPAALAFMLAAFALLSGLVLLINRFFLASGLRNELKGMRKREERAAAGQKL